MQKDPKLKKAMRRVAHILERSEFRVSLCVGILNEIFDITCDSIYSPIKDSGLYIKVAINSISNELLKVILAYPTHKKKELWVLKHSGSSTSPGTFLVYRVDGRKIVEYPKNWPIEKVMSSPKKRQANPQKKAVSSSKTKS